MRRFLLASCLLAIACDVGRRDPGAELREKIPAAAALLEKAAGTTFARAGGRLVARPADGHGLSAELSERYSDGYKVAARGSAAHALTLRPALGEGRAVLAGAGVVHYRGIASGIDALVAASGGELEEILLVRAPSVSSIEYTVERGAGIAGLRVADAGHVEALDQEGRAWLRAATPVVLDAAGRHVAGRWSVQGDRLIATWPTEGLTYPIAVDPTWTDTVGQMSGAHGFPSSSVLTSGKVLIAGGSTTTGVAGAGVEIFDPDTGTWTSAASLNTARVAHSATVLPSGKVLVAGGLNKFGGSPTATAAAEIYDPASAKWTPVAPLKEARGWHTATLLANGTVLFAGGTDGATTLQSAEIFDPATSTFTSLGTALASPREGHTATQMPDGTVVLAGGQSGAALLGSLESFNPATNTSSLLSGAPLVTPRSHHSASLLPLGPFLLFCGGVASAGPNNTCEYLLQGKMNALAALMTSPRAYHQAATLPDDSWVLFGGISQVGGAATGASDVWALGRASAFAATDAVGRAGTGGALLHSGQVLAAGGMTLDPVTVPAGNAAVTRSQIFDFMAGSSSATTDTSGQSQQRSGHTVTSLPDGRVLIAGGDFTVASPTGGTMISSTNATQLYDPATNQVIAGPVLNTARSNHTATVLYDGRVLFAGGYTATANGNTLNASLEIFDPNRNTFTTASATLAGSGRFRHAAALLDDGQVLFVGGSDLSQGTFVTADLYDPATGLLGPAASLPQSRTGATLTLLKTGEALLVGGTTSTAGADPALTFKYTKANGWTPVGSTATTARTLHTATLLPNGKVVVAGGNINFGKTRPPEVDVYDPSVGWTAGAPLPYGRESAAAVLRPDGKLLLLGGLGSPPGGQTSLLTDVLLYDPAENTWKLQGGMLAARRAHKLALSRTGAVVVAGAQDAVQVGPERYETPFAAGARPAVESAATQAWVAGPLPVVGPTAPTNLRGPTFFDAAGGTTGAASAGLPLVGLLRFEGGPAAFSSLTTWAANGLTATATVPAGTMPGLYRLTVFANGVGSEGQAVAINSPPTVGSAAFGTGRVGTAKIGAAMTLAATGSRLQTRIDSIALAGANPGDFAISFPALPALLDPAETIAITPTFTATALGSRSATLVVNGMALATLTGTGIFPRASITPGLAFGVQRTGVAAGNLIATLSNTGTDTLNIQTALLGGANQGDFSVSGVTGSLAAGGTLPLTVGFTPSAAGARTATLTLQTDVGPLNVALSGAGASPGLAIAPAALDFKNVRRNTMASLAVTVTNTANAIDLTPAMTGVGYSILPAGLTTLVAGGSQTFTVTFAPTATGTATGLLTFTSNQFTGAAGMVAPAVSLTGVGVQPAINVSITPATFAPAAVGSISATSAIVTVANTGTDALSLGGWTLSGANAKDFDVVEIGTGAGPIPPGQSLTYSVTFTPRVRGAESATLSFFSDAASGTSSAALSGTGLAPFAQLTTPASLSFGSQRVGTTGAAQSITILNGGNATLNVAAQAPPDNFVLAGGATSIAAGATATWTVKFKPLQTGAAAGSIAFLTDGGPIAVGVSGTGIFPSAALTSSALSFPDTVVATTAAAPLSATITNNGTDTLTVSGFTLVGNAPADFAVAPVSTSTTIAPGASASWSATFTPQATGTRSATISFATDNGALLVALSGRGLLATADLGTDCVIFPSTRKGTPSAAQTVRVTNNGNQALTISSASTAGSAEFAATPPGALPLTVQPGAFADVPVVFTPSAVGTRTGTLTLGTSVGNKTASLEGVGIYPTLSLSTAALAFGSQRAGTTSISAKITATNTGTDDLNLSAPALTGADFTLAGGAVAKLSAGASATWTIAFGKAATTIGAKTAALTFASTDAGIASQPVALAGTATAPNATLGSSTLAFGSVVRGSKATLSVALQNPQVAASTTDTLTVSGFTLTGAAAADFTVAPPASSVIAPNGSAQWAVTFSPSRGAAPAAEAATLTLKTDAGDQVVALSGTSLFPAASATPAALAFGLQPKGSSSAARAVAIGNSGTAALNISTWYVTGADAAEFSAATPSASAVASGATLGITVLFAPRAIGAKAAALVVQTDAGAVSVPLTGTGVDAALALSRAGIDFGSQRITSQGTAVALTATNATSGALTLRALVVTGANGSDFVVTAAPAFPITLAAGANAAFSVAFKPGVVGARAAAIAIDSDDASTLNTTVALSGTGISPTVDLGPSSLDFGRQRVGTAAAARPVVLANRGTDALHVVQVSLAGTAAAGFALSGVPALPATIAAGASLTVSVAYAPAAVGSDDASLVLTTDDPAGSTATVALHGQGTSPAVAVAPLALAFGAARVGHAAAPLAVVVTNSGGSAGQLTAASLSGRDAADFALLGLPTLPQALGGEGGAVSFLVQFKPSAHGDRSAVLQLTTDGGAASVAITGSGLAAGLSVTPTALDFGSLTSGGAAKALTLSITNGGDAPLRIALPQLTGTSAAAYAIQLAAGAAELAPGASAQATVTLAAAAAGATDATLRLASVDGDAAAAEIPLHALVVSPSLGLPDKLDLGTVAVGKTSTVRPTTVTNTGQGDLILIAVIAGPSTFAAQADGLPRTLKPGESANVGVTFSPTAAGPATGSLQIYVQGQSTPLGAIALVAIGAGKGGCATGTADVWAALGLLGTLLARVRRRSS